MQARDLDASGAACRGGMPLAEEATGISLPLSLSPSLPLPPSSPPFSLYSFSTPSLSL